MKTKPTKELSECFNLPEKAVVSIIGSGGKTNLLNYLAQKYAAEKVLVATTTKMRMPEKNEYDQIYFSEFDQLGKKNGISFAARVTSDEEKVTFPSDPAVRASFANFDQVFLEADGSKQLPLKAWADFEPVILPETTVTIGVLPIKALHKKINTTTVHRLPLFLEWLSVVAEEEISLKLLAEIVIQEKGLFYLAQGIEILFINQVDTKDDLENAQQLAEEINQFPHQITKIIAGSGQKEEGIILWEK